MSDNSNNVHFGKMWAAKESYAVKMNIIVILTTFKQKPIPKQICCKPQISYH